MKIELTLNSFFWQKLGINRTLVVNPRDLDKNGPKDANEALLRNFDLKEFIRDAKTLS